jgi:gamma-glutamylcyclotransferase (GGCT)/AIG2-like uncharacterized protein YtfP
MKGLIIKSPWIELILDGKKTWEIRGANTRIIGTVALIKSGSGKIFGEVTIVESRELSLVDYQETKKFHHVDSEKTLQLPYKKTYAWVMENPVIYKEPIPYKHPMGAVIWVNLVSEGKDCINE